jgi:protein-disulfide isomerase
MRSLRPAVLAAVTLGALSTLASAQAPPPSTLRIAGEPAQGSASARVVLIEFSDYECPYCATYATEVLPQVAAQYIATGKVRYVFRDYPLPMHANAGRAAEAAHCAGAQGKFWEMHDLLFTNAAALEVDKLPGYAKTLGLDGKAFGACLSSGRFAADIRQDVAEANAAGVNSTPSFFVGLAQPDGSVKLVRRLNGARPFADFRAVIESALQTQ